MEVFLSPVMDVFSIISSIIPFIILIGVVVTVHEFGHYLAGRSFGAAVESFAFGFGKSIYERTDRIGTRWRINWLPLGGFVKFVGETNQDDGAENTRIKPVGKVYTDLAPWQRVIVSLAGPITNFILAILIFAVLFMNFGKPIFGDVTIQGFSKDSAALMAGLEEGDKIIEADGKRVESVQDVQSAVVYSAGEPVPFVIKRDEELIELNIVPIRSVLENERLGVKEEVGIIGVALAAEHIGTEKIGVIKAISLGADQTAQVIRQTIKVLKRLIFGQDNFEKMRGPLGIGDIADRVVDSHMKRTDVGLEKRIESAFWELTQYIALFSVSIGFFNLLPIPMLDGYSAMLGLYETIVGAQISANVQEYLLRGGLAAIGVFFIAVTINDLKRLGLLEIFSGLLS